MDADATNDMVEQIITALSTHATDEFVERRDFFLKQQLVVLIHQVRSEQLMEVTRELAGLFVVARAYRVLTGSSQQGT